MAHLNSSGLVPRLRFQEADPLLHPYRRAHLILGARTRLRVCALVLVVMTVFAGASWAQPAEHSEVVIRGTVQDQAGMALSDYPVRLIKTKTILNIFRFRTASQPMEENQTTTDSKGQFELRLIPDPQYDYFYLRFYDPKTFDPVRYRVPADVDITRQFKRGPEVVVHHVIQIHTHWPQVKKLADEYGRDSNRGKILLSLGLPERREKLPGTSERENWWYYSKGLCYQLRGDEVVRVRRYDPVLPPPGVG